jgi:hypothetical protein
VAAGFSCNSGSQSAPANHAVDIGLAHRSLGELAGAADRGAEQKRFWIGRETGLINIFLEIFSRLW